MGVDFRIDDTPKFVLMGSITDWGNRTQSWNREEISVEDLRAIFEDLPTEIDLHVISVPREPSLDDAPEVDSPSWAYSGFSRFRRRLADVEGIDIDLMQGWRDDFILMRRFFPDASAGADLDRLKPLIDERYAAQMIRWSEVESGLVPLLDHSDCEDDLSPEECAQVAPALREAMAKLAPYDREGGDRAVLDYDVEKGERLAQMMDICAKYNRRLVFC